ncbi:MAG: aminotransferase class I/II-fold pyridoxal phosphate-dependent enzyme [Rhodospirillaceae bacterium]|nr:aminotransferase class I/II-fold pyridoxal phosphate-dependent enzyme [Rhodospirillaceae bacterium]
MDFNEKSADELAGIGAEAQATYEGIRGKNLALDMTRGKPAPDQLDLSNGILTVVGPGDTDGDDGTDYRNYGIPEAKALFAEYMEVAPAEIIVGGNSSLTMMYDTIVGGMLFGMPGGSAPWGDQGSVKFICPVPGYDRHFAICERLGVGMVTVPMTPDGPDMDAVEALVADDASVKGIWCVPKYSNPSGEDYSDDVVDRLANMQVAAPDFRVIWDNAYNVHHIGEGPAPLKNLLAACKNAGTPDRVLMFGSTSKLTLPGAGVAVLAASEANIQDALKKMFYSAIGPDKINQLRHVRFFKDMDGLRAHMDAQAAIIGPKFAAVEDALQRRLAGKGIAKWTSPKGGYFVSVDVLDGCASEIIRLAGEAGVTLTPAGSTYPLGEDPNDRNIRLAPTMPTVGEVKSAMEVF